MDDGDNIYVDARQPATLHDGPMHTDCPTLQEAKIAWDRLPPERQRTATISSGGEVYTAREINRLSYGPAPDIDLSPADEGDSVHTACEQRRNFRSAGNRATRDATWHFASAPARGRNTNRSS